MYRILLSSALLIFGAALTAGGVWLALLGGSVFYIALGAAIVASAALLLARQPAGLALYGLVLLVTLVWSIAEIGFDWWALAPRGALLVVLGLLALLPPMSRGLRGGAGAARGILGIALFVCGAAALYAVATPSNDLSGAFSSERMASSAEIAVDGVADGDWAAYGRTSYGRRYSPLNQITPANVGALEVAWRYETGQIRGDKDPTETTYEVTPLVVDDTMYVCTPFSTVIALDPVTGKEKWKFDPGLKQPPKQTQQHMTCRGVTYFDGAAHPYQPPAAQPLGAGSGVAGPEAAEGSGDGSAQETAATAPQPAPAPAQAAPILTAAEAKAQSVAEVTTEAAGVHQNVVIGAAAEGAPNPRVPRDAPGRPNLSPECAKRIFAPTADGRLISLSAETGEICPGFGGPDGTVNLWANMPNVTPGSFYATSPPVVTDRLIIVGGAVNDNASTTSPSGVIRAYDVWTGELVWNFDSKNPEATRPIPEGETYSENAPNSWSVSSYDPELGLIYIPMGNESPDQFGGDRGDETERFSSSVLALRADTGRIAWVYQTVHHDLWDMDVPAQPVLVDLTIGGVRVPALAQATKQGEIYVLDRRTGKPLLPVKEEPAPQGAVDGDFTAPTQPVSTISFNPKPLREADMWGATPLDQLACRIRFRQLRYEGRYTPPSEQGTIVYPGNFGAFNWGSVAVDPEREILFGMPVHMAFTSKMIERKAPDKRLVTADGDAVFNENFGARYASEMGPFLSPLGLPCQQPPWGYVAGVDLRTGQTVYEHVNGTVEDLSPLPLPFKMGVPGIGGPIVTKGGVAFLSGTLDYYVRGYDLRTGEEIWRSRLPAGGQATPSTYLGRDGRQYLVVVAGGHGSTGAKAGDSIIAYALSKQG